MMYKMIWVGRQFLMSYSEVINSLLAQLQGYDDSEFGDNESSQKMDDKKDFLKENRPLRLIVHYSFY